MLQRAFRFEDGRAVADSVEGIQRGAAWRGCQQRALKLAMR